MQKIFKWDSHVFQEILSWQAVELCCFYLPLLIEHVWSCLLNWPEIQTIFQAPSNCYVLCLSDVTFQLLSACFLITVDHTCTYQSGVGKCSDGRFCVQKVFSTGPFCFWDLVLQLLAVFGVLNSNFYLSCSMRRPLQVYFERKKNDCFHFIKLKTSACYKHHKQAVSDMYIFLKCC